MELSRISVGKQYSLHFVSTYFPIVRFPDKGRVSAAASLTAADRTLRQGRPVLTAAAWRYHATTPIPDRKGNNGIYKLKKFGIVQKNPMRENQLGHDMGE